MNRAFAQLRHFSLFVGVGGLSAAIDVGIIQIMLLSGFSAPLAVTVGFVGGLVVNYLFHLSVTFKSTSSSKTVFRFLTVVALNYLITISIVYLANSVFGLSVILGKICSLPVVAANGFVLSKYWVFK